MRTLLLVAVLAMVATACAGADADVASNAAGVRVIDAESAAAVIDAQPERVVLDIRTPEEFAGGHLDGARLIDFYAPDFADQVAALDRDAPYLIYCRSGNRSGQARQLMADLGFADVIDVDGGIVAWVNAGLPVVT